MTIPMPTMERIRAMDARGTSARQIAKELGVSRNTVAKYVAQEDFSPKPMAHSPRSIVDEYAHIITGWLIDDLKAAAAGMLEKQLTQIGRHELIIIDELGYLPIDNQGARLLFQVIADAYEKRSIVYTSNLEFSRWGQVFGDDQMAAAIIYRTVHHGRMVR